MGKRSEDWLTALAAKTREAEYVATVERHREGKRGCDLMRQMFGSLVAAMDNQDADILDDLLQGNTYGEAIQYFSPEWVSSRYLPFRLA